jgi:MFS family permease
MLITFVSALDSTVRPFAPPPCTFPPAHLRSSSPPSPPLRGTSKPLTPSTPGSARQVIPMGLVSPAYPLCPAHEALIIQSYLLGQTILTPINGRVSDITGRKPMLYTSTLFLMVFSALCGSAQNITWCVAPCACRRVLKPTSSVTTDHQVDRCPILRRSGRRRHRQSIVSGLGISLHHAVDPIRNL